MVRRTSAFISSLTSCSVHVGSPLFSLIEKNKHASKTARRDKPEHDLHRFDYGEKRGEGGIIMRRNQGNG